MAKVFLYEGDSGIVVVSPAAQLDIDEFAKNFVPPKTKYNIIESSQLPPDPEFSGAWTIDCDVDIKKAKQIWLDKIRVVRDQRLKELDIKWMRAMENGESKVASSVAAKKQMLRDVTEREDFKKAKTLEQIKKYWPEILEG